MNMPHSRTKIRNKIVYLGLLSFLAPWLQFYHHLSVMKEGKIAYAIKFLVLSTSIWKLKFPTILSPIFSVLASLITYLDMIPSLGSCVWVVTSTFLMVRMLNANFVHNQDNLEMVPIVATVSEFLRRYIPGLHYVLDDRFVALLPLFSLIVPNVAMIFREELPNVSRSRRRNLGRIPLPTITSFWDSGSFYMGDFTGDIDESRKIVALSVTEDISLGRRGVEKFKWILMMRQCACVAGASYEIVATVAVVFFLRKLFRTDGFFSAIFSPTFLMTCLAFLGPVLYNSEYVKAVRNVSVIFTSSNEERLHARLIDQARRM